MSKIRPTNPQIPTLKAQPPKADDKKKKDAPPKRDHHHDHKPARGERAEVRGRYTGKGTPDDSIGRYTGKGTPDDSIGRFNGRGTPDDSIGRFNGRGTPDDSIGRSQFSRGVLVKGQYVGGAPSAAQRPITYVKGQPVYASPNSLASLGTARTISSKDMKRAMDGVNKRSRETAQQLMARPAAQKVLASSSFQALPSAQRESLIDVMAKGGPRASEGLAHMIKDKRLAVLQAADGQGTTVLAHLDRMAASKHPSIAGDVLADLARPREVQQGFAPTCTATSMQYEMVKERPGEYARLMAGLASDGRVTMAGGGVLAVDVDKAMRASDQKRDFRSDSEAVFQSAVMEYANGGASYDLGKQLSVDGNKTYRGLFPEQIRQMTGQLFGSRYETLQVLNDDMARAELAVISSRERPNRPVLFDINMGSYNHNVSLESVTDKKVFFRDPSTGDVKAMDRSDFINKLTSVHYAVE
jgi:hypothetical protein